MAEIPVARKSGGLPWWLLLLALLGLLLLAALLMRGCNSAGVVNTNDNANVAVGTGNTASGNTNNARNTSNINVSGVGSSSGANVTDVNIFGSTADKQSLVNRRVDLTNVRVARVLSDRVFTVTSGSDEMFVMLDENLDSGGGREQQIRIRSGQLVNLGGTFQRVPSAETRDERQRDLNARELAQMANQQVYLHCTEVRNAS